MKVTFGTTALPPGGRVHDPNEGGYCRRCGKEMDVGDFLRIVNNPSALPCPGSN